jgi:ATP-dependent DNA helicase PIF1
VALMADLDDIAKTFVDSDIDLGEDIPLEEPYCEFLTGSAGTGKTFELQRRMKEDPSYGVFGCTTGIAAVNLGTRTINSILGYFNTPSLQDNFRLGYLQSRLRKLALEDGVRHIVIDELSMMSPSALQTIYDGIREVNGQKGMRDVGAKLGLVLSGDFCQLRPVYEKGEIDEGYAFNAQCWPQFAQNTIRLSKIWRQDNPRFLEAINLLRGGRGAEAAEVLKSIMRFQINVDPRFDGTTILSVNKEVERTNILRLQQVRGRPVVVTSRRWGKPSGEWKHIPDQLVLKIDALVMILANDAPEFSFVNGDLGHVKDFTGSDSGQAQSFQVELKRNSQIVNIHKIYRSTMIKDEPAEIRSGQLKLENVPHCSPPVSPPPFGMISLDPERGIWHIGGIEYFPLRIGYAATVHKTQGLSLDNVQVDYRGRFFGNPASLYVAVARCRTPEGLRLVGMPEVFAKRCVIDKEVEPWL